MSKIISATQARKQFFQLIKLASKPGERISITNRDKPSVILLPKSDWELVKQRIGA